MMAMMAGAVVLLWALVLTGCAANAGVSPTPASTVDTSGGTPGAHPTLTLPTMTAVASPSGNSGTGGADAFCSGPTKISIQPGSNIPAYPGAVLHFSQANGSNAFFGFCTGASTSDVQYFYALHLPKSGWSTLHTSTIASVVQITASQCASKSAPQIIVTIAPDASGTTTTSISIVVLAGTC